MISTWIVISMWIKASELSGTAPASEGPVRAFILVPQFVQEFGWATGRGLNGPSALVSRQTPTTVPGEQLCAVESRLLRVPALLGYKWSISAH